MKAKITPEHKIRSKAYDVHVVINEKEEEVISCQCHSCPASEGGCKHGVAFLLWLHRRSSESSVTSQECYWKASKLSKVGKTDVDISTLFGKRCPKLQDRDESILNMVVDNYKNTNGMLFHFFKEPKYKISIHQLLLNYFKTNGDHSADEFILYGKSEMTYVLCEQAEIETRKQSKAKEWFELRYGRITASIVYEAAKCKTLSDALTKKILGATAPLETDPITRGKKLEPLVLKVIAEKRGLKISEGGLFLKSNYPLFGASPDAITENYAIEIKCPYQDKSVKRYISNGKITEKYWYQLQMQMFFANKQKGIFCIALPTFENDNAVEMIDVDFQEEKLQDILTMCEDFWKNAIYPKLKTSYC